MIVDGTGELVRTMIEQNGIAAPDVISMLFTVTPDLRSEFPAAAVRAAGMHDVPLMCATEIGVRNALPRVIRVMALVESDVPRSSIRHVYLGGTAGLRPDLAPVEASGGVQ
jgi:chorismate mutase